METLTPEMMIAGGIAVLITFVIAVMFFVASEWKKEEYDRIRKLARSCSIPEIFEK